MSQSRPVSSVAQRAAAVVVASFALAGLAGLAGCGKKPEAQDAGGHGGAPGGAMPAMPVAVRTVQQQNVPVLIDAVGQAEGSKEVEVRARVTGLIERQFYTEGDRVKAGAPLFAIERGPFENALAQARAQLATATSQLDAAKREANRLRPLAQMQAIAQREADDAITLQRNAESAVTSAQAGVRDAELNLSYTRVVAPIAGVTGRAEKSQGSLVGPSDGLLSRVTQTDPVWVRFAFSESELAQLHNGRGAAVRLLDADGKPVGATGKLNFTGSAVDARLGTVQLRAEFPNPKLEVLPGQFVKAQVNAGQQRAWLVPQAAVFTGDKGKTVWIVRDGKATPTPVQVGGWVGADWAVQKGLQDGDQVIVDNLLKLRPGAPVQPKAAAAAASGAAPGAPAPAASAASTATR